MSISIPSFTSNRENDSGKVTLTKPSNVNVNDLLIILVANGSEANTAQWDNSALKPVGFELIQEGGNSTSDCHFAAFWRVADGSEGSTIDVPCESNTVEVHGTYIHVVGADPSNPIHVVGPVLTEENTPVHDISMPETAIDGCMGMFIFGHDNGDAVPFVLDSTWTLGEELDSIALTNQIASLWGYTQIIVAGFPDGDDDVTINDSSSDHDGGGFAFAITPKIITSEDKFQWKVHSSHTDYWRSDNPYIVAWYRFGEDEFPVSETLGEPARCDSGPRHHYLTSNQALGTFVNYVSGVAPWSSSGVRFEGTWPENPGPNRALRTDSIYYRDRTDFSTMGYYGQGNADTSGFTIMGWMKISAAQDLLTVKRKVWGNIEGPVSANDGEWMLELDPDTRHLEFTYNSFGTATTPAGASHTATSINHPQGFLPVDEPVFFACQINKGHPASHENVNEGSGVLRIFLGTHVSGLTDVGALEISVPSTNFWRGDNTMHANTNFPYTFGADPVSARGNSNARAVPPSSVLDEFIVMYDGNLTLERMEHYMNSGIVQNNQDPLSLVEDFIPVPPGTGDLVAYWSFDEQGGANTSPNTDNTLDMVLNGVSFVAGINGGSGIRPNNAFIDFINETFPTNKTGLPHVIGGSGLNSLFPEKDQTWIGWVRSEGAGNRGGTFGWFSDTGDRHMAAYWQTQLTAVTNVKNGHVDVATTPSGGPFARLASNGAIGSFNANNGRTMEAGDWHLLALVWDITHGFVRVVYDATDVYPILMAESFSVSGFTKQHLEDSGPDGAGFVLTNINIDRCSYDDWAVYDRALTLPEMSGYAISGIQVPSFVSPIDTSFKRTLGYWKLDEQDIYDPEGISGIRYSDASWYRHHLTQTSGRFVQGDALNGGIASTTAEVAHSGSVLAVPLTDSGPNLDFSTSGVWATSGFTAGCWMYVPSGDLGTQGNGSSGLYGDKMFMGVWGQGQDDRSWLLGIRDNLFLASVRLPGLPPTYIESTTSIPFNEPFFVAMKATPSGSNTTVEIYTSTDLATDSVILVGRDVGVGGTNKLGAGSTSGFSLLGAADLPFGFPSGTRIQMPFVYAGQLENSDLGLVKLVGVRDNVLASGGVSIVDPANISHWRLDDYGTQLEDRGQAQNFLTIINNDGNEIGVEPAIHNRGVTIRQPEYLVTQRDFATSGLDLATDNKSWTFVTWVKPNVDNPASESVIMGKGGPSSGIEVLMSDGSHNPGARASGVTTQAYNGDLLPGEWNHLAIVFDRDNDEFTTIVNGRYAGSEFTQLLEVPLNNSGLALGGRGDQEFLAIPGGTSFSGVMDDALLFSRALTLPEISGLAANSYNFLENLGASSGFPVGLWITGRAQNLVSGLIGAFLYGQAQDVELVGGYVSGVSGALSHMGGFIHGRSSTSGLVGNFLHGSDQVSGLFAHFVHGVDNVSGFFGSWTFGAEQATSEFDITLDFRVVAFQSFDARLGVEKTKLKDFDARLGVIHITRPPDCTLELPLVGTVGSGLPFDLVVRGSGIAYENKKVSHVRFTFADFKGAESGTLVSGLPNSGLFEASRQFDTQGWYNVKVEVTDSFGYRTSCVRPFLLLPEGAESGTFINSLPGISLTATPKTGSTVQRVLFEHAISGLDTISGLLEYTDFADQQESLVNSFEMPSGSQIFASGFREHDYGVPGRYCPVWSVSGEFGIVSDSIADGIDYLV